MSVRERVVKPALKAAIGGMVLITPAAGAAHAEPVTFFGYILNASISGQYAPSYEGGKRYSWFPGGSLAITKPWEFDAFSPPDDAASLGLVNTKNVQFGLALSLRENRGNRDELEGMRNIGWAFQGGGYMNVWPTRNTRIHVEALKGLTAESGLLINSGLDYVVHPKDWNLSLGPRYSWGDDRFMGTYFGVTPSEAQASPYIAAPFHARAGSHYAGVEAMAEYKWKPRWRLTLNASYHRMMDDAARSPLTHQLGSVDQFNIGAGIRFMLQQ